MNEDYPEVRYYNVLDALKERKKVCVLDKAEGKVKACGEMKAVEIIALISDAGGVEGRYYFYEVPSYPNGGVDFV